jgi:hypothetical protein
MVNYKRTTKNTYDKIASKVGPTYDDYFNAPI